MMIDIELIEDTIEELENSATSFENCEKLASLYICRMMYQNANMKLSDVSERVSYNNVDSQLQDILPAYNKYVEAKRRYQQFEVVDKMLIYAMEDLCKEITEFIADLYHNTETTAERALIVEMINEMRSVI
jgi:predicted transcriptional regulator